MPAQRRDRVRDVDVPRRNFDLYGDRLIRELRVLATHHELDVIARFEFGVALFATNRSRFEQKLGTVFDGRNETALRLAE